MCFQEPRAAMPPNLSLDMAESDCETPPADELLGAATRLILSARNYLAERAA